MADFVNESADEASNDDDSGTDGEFGDHATSSKKTKKKSSSKKRIIDSSDEDEEGKLVRIYLPSVSYYMLIIRGRRNAC